jgi:hypothetical protein
VWRRKVVMEALVVRQILGMQSSIILPDLGLMQNGKNGGLGEEHGTLGPQQLLPPPVVMVQLAVMLLFLATHGSPRVTLGEQAQIVKMTVWGVVTKSACLNSQVKMTKMAW